MIRLIYFIRLLFIPVFWALSFIIPPLKKRRKFEQKNKLIDFPNWKQNHEKADYAFSISSEGELEQILPLLLYYLNDHKKIELVYTSNSVDHKVNNLAQEYKMNLAVIRMPLVSYRLNGSMRFNCSKFITASVLYFCRYDFFPELLYLKYSRGDLRFVLLSARIKAEYFTGLGLKNLYYRSVFKLMDEFVATTSGDIDLLARYLPLKLSKAIDFRVIQINQRLEIQNSTLNQRLKNYSQLLEHLKKYQRDEILIGGSFWPLDLPILNCFSWVKCFLIAPHDLADSNLEKLYQCLTNKLGKGAYLEDGIIGDEKFIMIRTKGILCEMYHLGGWSYVGGGYGRSIHSVLEPFLAGSKVCCGPKVNRSSEFELIRHLTHDQWPRVATINFELKLDLSYNELKLLNFKNQLIENHQNAWISFIKEAQC
jgi:3-deoxy-D-manno-octulosonic-acid transferase